MLNNVRVVLVETSHAGNIGAAARAMKNMGLSHLYLVAPKQFPHPDASARASRADDILENAVVVEHLEEALQECKWVVGASARERTARRSVLDVRQAARQAIDEASSHPVAIVFGSERVGLENHHLERCHAQLVIPTVADYSSLNLGAAVQVVTYELYMVASQKTDVTIQRHFRDLSRRSIAKPEGGNPGLAPAEDLERLYRHIEATMIDIGFLNPDNPRTMMHRIRALFQRARPDVEDVHLFRGMMKAIQGLCTL